MPIVARQRGEFQHGRSPIFRVICLGRTLTVLVLSVFRCFATDGCFGTQINPLVASV